MPTSADVYKLANNCDTEWTTCNGVYGRLIKGRGAFASRSIFLPAAGYGSESTLYYPGEEGEYCSSTPYSSVTAAAYGLRFTSDSITRDMTARISGETVRPLRDPAQ